MQEWLVVALRSLFALTFLFILTRILGKKQISQLNFFEYIVGITLGELAGFISINGENIFLGVVAILIWFIVPFLLEYAALKSKKLRELFEGKPTIFIKEGKVLEDNLKKERYTADELMEQLRTKNVFKLADVEFAMLEPTGDLSVLLTKENQPLTPKHLGIKVGPEREAQTVIIDGNMMDEPLATAGLSRQWLHTELEKIGVTLDNVFMGQVDTYGQLTVDLYDDMLKVPNPSQKPLLFATLKKCEADLSLFALSTNDQQAKALYERCSQEMDQVIKQVKPVLQR